jgi:hypothetical protein
MRPSHRIALAALGVVVVFIGLFAWSVEDSSGSGLNFATEPGAAEGVVTVYEVDEGVGGGDTPVFEGTRAAASEYMERRTSAGESFVIPGVIIGVGAALVLLAIAPWRGHPETHGEASPRP